MPTRSGEKYIQEILDRAEEINGEYEGELTKAREALAQSESRRKKLLILLRDAEAWLGPDHPHWQPNEKGTLENLHERIVIALSKEPK